MPSPEEIAAALERWQTAKEKWRATGGREWSDMEIAGDALSSRVSALLADVARLQKELDGTTFREERYAEDAAGARLALEEARAERDEARATLAAAEVKLAQANEILAVDGREVE